MGILNPKRRIGVAFLTFIATCLLCISLYSGYATISIANENSNRVLGLTVSQKISAIKTYAAKYSVSKISGSCSGKSCATKAYQTAGDSSHHNIGNYSNCNSFVHVVMVDSKADTSFPSDSVPTQKEYLDDNTGSGKKYSRTDITNTSSSKMSSVVKSGDIIVVGTSHIYFAGDSAKSSWQASQGSQVPNVRGSVWGTNDAIADGDTVYRYRVIK